MLAALVASIHKTEQHGDQVLEVLAGYPSYWDKPQQLKNKIRIKSSCLELYLCRASPILTLLHTVLICSLSNYYSFFLIDFTNIII